MTLTPAYGRDCKNKADVLAAWNADKDFVVADLFHGGGTYTNKSNTPKGMSVTIRYARLTKAVNLHA